MKEYRVAQKDQMKCFLSNWKPSTLPQLLLFFDASWVEEDSSGGAGFFVATSNYHTVFPGHVGLRATNSYDAEARPFMIAFQVLKWLGLDINFAFMDCLKPYGCLVNLETSFCWRLNIVETSSSMRFE